MLWAEKEFQAFATDPIREKSLVSARFRTFVIDVITLPRL